MRNTMRNTLTDEDVEGLTRMVKSKSEDELRSAFFEAAQDFCIETLKEGDCDLNLTGKCKKCYDYLAEQFTYNYMKGKSLTTILEDTGRGKFYNNWKGFLCGVKYIVEDGGKFHGSLGRGIEGIVNNSGISRKTWIKFLDYYFS